LKKTIIAILKILIPLGVGIYLIWYYYDKMSEDQRDQAFNAIQEANYFWLGLSMLLGLFSHMSRAYRWKYTLEPLGYKPKFWHLYHGVMIGYIVNLTIPRSGEASRAGFLYSTDDIPFTKSFGTIIAERAVDLIMLGIITLITIAMQYSKFDEIKDLLFGVKENTQQVEESGPNYFLIIASTILLFGIAVLIFSPKIREKVFGIIKNVLDGVKSIFKSKNPGGFILHTFIIWFLYVIMFIVAFKSIPATANMPLAGSLAAFISGTVGLIFIPGGIGVYPALVATITTFYLFPDYVDSVGNTANSLHPQAVAIGWLIWIAQTSLIVVLGIISLLIGSMIRKKSKHEQTSTH
jgi:uncharacterized membrane protein YbhN (UPF0104 family)